MTAQESRRQQPSAGTWRPVERARAYELVIARVEEEIGAGRLTVGDRLPAERDLATMLGVSRTAVREAIRALEAQGVVRSGVGVGPDSGTVLTSMSSSAMTQLLRLHVGLASFPMTDVIEARIMLERWSARLAARDGTQEAVTHLRSLVEQMDDPQLPRETFNELDTAFHVAMAEASCNRLVADLTTAIRASMKAPILRSFQERVGWDETVQELRRGHRAVLEAVEARDETGAADAVEAHIRYAFSTLTWGQD